MGTSNSSSDIASVFKSIQEQFENIFSIDAQSIEYNDKFTFESKLCFISTKYLKSDKQLIILLDSIDQLSKNDYNLQWLFTKLPKNIKLVFSVLPNYENILDNLKKKIKNENIHILKPFKSTQTKEFLLNYLKSANRKLSHEQSNLIDKMIDQLEDINPLQIKLIFDIVSKWPSFYKVSDEFLNCRSSIQIIKYHFNNIEKNVFDNEILFKHCLFYLTLFEYRGISENELEDILSIDDEVLDSIFVHHHPPVRRFQIGLFSRLKYELKDYIINKVTDDQPVIAW